MHTRNGINSLTAEISENDFFFESHYWLKAYMRAHKATIGNKNQFMLSVRSPFFLFMLKSITRIRKPYFLFLNFATICGSKHEISWHFERLIPIFIR